MAGLLDLCHELVHSIFVQVNPSDLETLSRTCSTFRKFIQSNRLLFRQQYLARYDDPRTSSSSEEPDWERQLPQLAHLENLLYSYQHGLKRAYREMATERIIYLLETAHPDPSKSLNILLLTLAFQSDSTNVDEFLTCSELYKRAALAEDTPFIESPTLPQLSAKLHCHWGVPIQKTRSGLETAHTYARSLVYDLREYSDDTLWGPFLADGTGNADWEKLEALMLVLDYNLTAFSERTDGAFRHIWDRPWAGATPNSFMPLACPMGHAPSKGLALPLDAQDPYGVTGTWRRVVCFLDYNDLYTYNFPDIPLPSDTYRDPIDTQEAIRLIILKLRVTRIEPPGEDDGQALPVVHFKGSSRSMHASWDPNANSTLKGTVRLTPGGDVRWTTLSVFYGDERWRSEGIQIGGPRSARGVIGTWFDKDYDMHGPAGPTAFWKLNDEIGESKADSAATGLAFF